MAVLGKIRNRSLLLIGIIGFALFAFIAGDMFRSCDSHRAERSQRVGEVLGKKIDIQTFNAMLEEQRLIQGGGRELSAEQQEMLNDKVWQEYVSNQVLEDECEKLGLTVTDKELQDVLADGTNPLLTQTPFVNQQTGKFDYNMVKQQLNEVDKQAAANPQIAEQAKLLKTYWNYTEKQLRTTLLQQKYQTLLAGCLVPNNITAKALFDGTNEESTIDLVAIPYSSVNDNDVKIEDADYKAKYEEMKNAFYNPYETRSVQYVDFLITPSAADMADIKKEFEGYKAKLASDSIAVADIVGKSGSLFPYNGLAKTKTAYPQDVAALLDSVAVGTTTAVTENKADGTMNVVKVLGKVSLPDSVEFRAIQIVDQDIAKAGTRADSVLNALKGGADFETIAKKYGQTGTKSWLTSADYQNAPSFDEDTKNYLNTLLTGEVNEIQKVKLAQGAIILQVTEKKAFTDMWDVAVIKKEIQFSKTTRQDAYNKFSAYVAKCKTLEDLKKYAKENGYEVKQADVAMASHNVAGINSTKDALRWIFNDGTKVGDMYTDHLECGNNGDHLMVVVLDKINKQGFLDYTDEIVKNALKPLILNDKKAEKIMAQVKDFESAKKVKGAKVLEVPQVSFGNPAFIPEFGPEPAISGAVAATPQGKACKKAVKGNMGVYMLKVKERKTLGNKYDQKAAFTQAHQKAMMAAQTYMNDLVFNSGLKDNRYIFF